MSNIKEFNITNFILKVTVSKIVTYNWHEPIYRTALFFSVFIATYYENHHHVEPQIYILVKVWRPEIRHYS